MVHNSIKMSMSKNVKSYQRCVCVAARRYNTESASTSAATPERRDEKKMSAVSQLRSLTSSQLKAINQFSKYIVKSAYDQGMTVAVNKEWIRMIQRLPTMMKSDQIIQNSSASTSTSQETDTAKVNTTAAQAVTETLSKVQEENSADIPTAAPTGYSIPQVLHNLKLNFSTTPKQNAEAAQAQTIPQWKVKKSVVVAKEIIATRTRHVLSSVAAAESTASRLKRLEDLMSHLVQYPQAKSLAVKSGAINTLMRMRRYAKDQDTQSTLREALAMLGHIEPLPGRGIRILAMDGGGTRGLVVIELLRKLEALTGRRVCDMFDYICGVSTGAIMACLFGPHKKNLDDCEAMYRQISIQIFNQSAIWGTGSLLWSHSYYDTAQWESILKNNVGDMPLIKTARDPECPKMSAVSAVVNQTRVRPFVFRNYELPSGVPALYNGSSRAELWQAVRASAAAPSYFEEFRLGDLLHQDGGILVNNPTAVAIHEAKLLWPGEALQCVVSFGTGRNHPVDLALQDGVSTNGDSYSSWKTKFSKILDSATDTEAVHSMLHDLLPNDVYFRFNPYVNEVAGMDEVRPEKLEMLKQNAIMYARRNDEKFMQVAAALTQTRSNVQKGQDWLKLQSALMSSK